MAMKPGGGGGHKIVTREKDGSIDQTAKLQQSTIQRGKRTRKRKKIHVEAVSQADFEIEQLMQESVAPQLFLDKEAMERERLEKEEAEKQRLIAAKGTESKAKSNGKNASKGKAA